MVKVRAVGLGLVAVLALSAGMADAQRTLRNTAGPAETPPASFTGAQFVDSNGCVFIRAGLDGATRWVPRVNRDRTVVCGAQPTATASAPARRPAAEPQPTVQQITVAAPAAEEATPAPAPVRAAEPVIRRTPAAAAPRTIEVAPVRTVSAPRTVAPRPAAAPAPRRAAAPRPMPQVVRAPAVALRPGCGASALSAQYIPGCNPGTTAARPSISVASPAISTVPSQPRRRTRAQDQVVVRAAPPAGAVRVNPTTPSPRRAAPAGVRAGGCAGASDLSARYLAGTSHCGGDSSWTPGQTSSLGTTASSRNQRVVIVPAARTTFDVTTPPPGYRAAWNDGRLNPQRGPRTLQGDYQSQAVWTNQTPRRLQPVIFTTR